MKCIPLFILMGGAFISGLAQDNNPACLENTYPFFSIPDGFYVTDNCTYSEYFAYEFWVDRGSRAIRKEGVYREVWIRRKEGSNRHMSGLQILKLHNTAIITAGGEIVQGSDGNVLKIMYQGKEIWFFINANTFAPDLDNYGIVSIEVDDATGENTVRPAGGSTGTNTTGGTTESLKPPIQVIHVDSIHLAQQFTNLSPSELAHITIPTPQDELNSVLPPNLIHSLSLSEPPGQLSLQQTTATTEPVHTYGEHYLGGIIFYLYDDGKHGLIAAPEDLRDCQWYPLSDHATSFHRPATMATGSGIESGKANTALIISSVGQAWAGNYMTYAALRCNEYKSWDNAQRAFGGWYLPSLYELFILYQRKDIVGNLGNAWYWSSTEAKDENAPYGAWEMNFSTGESELQIKFITRAVRPIRSF